MAALFITSTESRKPYGFDNTTLCTPTHFIKHLQNSAIHYEMCLETQNMGSLNNSYHIYVIYQQPIFP